MNGHQITVGANAQVFAVFYSDWLRIIHAHVFFSVYKMPKFTIQAYADRCQKVLMYVQPSRL